MNTSLMLRLLNDAVDYMDYDPTRSKSLIKRVMYWLEEEAPPKDDGDSYGNEW